jgi:hypothetical protein
VKIDASAARSLKAVIINDIHIIHDLTGKIIALTPDRIDERDLATVAYALHNVYNALENSFEQISRTFENHVVDTTRWHRELCAKMFLEIDKIRPAVLSAKVRQLVDEMLRFRHLFRHSYDFRIDPERLRMLSDQWKKGHQEVVNELERFGNHLGKVGD